MGVFDMPMGNPLTDPVNTNSNNLPEAVPMFVFGQPQHQHPQKQHPQNSEQVPPQQERPPTQTKQGPPTGPPAPAANAGGGGSRSGAEQEDVILSPEDYVMAHLGEAPPLPPSYWAPEGDGPLSFSIIIPTHNIAERIVSTLLSVEESILFFLKNAASTKPVKGEVIIVDDASTDNTVSVVMSFIEQRRTNNILNPIWKLLALQTNVLGGAARNFGVRESTGEVLFFCDGDDLFLSEHIIRCFYALHTNPQAAYVQTQAKVDLPTVHPEWRQRIDATLPLNKCIWRKVHDFVEGFPEQGVFNRHQDVGYFFSFNLLRVLHAEIPKETVVYQRWPGNSLDQQVTKFGMSPAVAPPSPEEKSELYQARLAILKHHSQHLVKKLQNLAQGIPTETNTYWAIYQHAIDTLKPPSWNSLNYKKIKYKRLLQVADHMMETGRLDEAKKIFGVVHRFVYNITEDVGPTPFYWMHSSVPSTLA